MVRQKRRSIKSLLADFDIAGLSTGIINTDLFPTITSRDTGKTSKLLLIAGNDQISVQGERQNLENEELLVFNALLFFRGTALRVGDVASSLDISVDKTREVFSDLSAKCNSRETIIRCHLAHTKPKSNHGFFLDRKLVIIDSRDHTALRQAPPKVFKVLPVSRSKPSRRASSYPKSVKKIT